MTGGAVDRGMPASGLEESYLLGRPEDKYCERKEQTKGR